MRNAIKRILAFVLLWCLLISAFAPCVYAADSDERFLSVAERVIRWKKAEVGVQEDGNLFSGAFLELAGSTAGDWYPIALSRLGVNDDYTAYRAVLRAQVEERYRQSGLLSAAKATEWHRIALAALASGGDPTAFGKTADGRTINLIADGVYDRGKTASLGRQGINGWIWGLLAIDSMRYAVPEGANTTRDDILLKILSLQLADGGFALRGASADPDVTAMAVQAFAPYYNSEKKYTYTQSVTNTQVTKTVRTVVDEALACLSDLQSETGDFGSWGTQNTESTCQVMIALCCLGIDPLTDPRFIKNGHTLFDGMMRYQMPDGGFAHAFAYDAQRPDAKPKQSDTMAGEQTLLAMAALLRQRAGKRTLYDFRPEQSAALKTRIAKLEADIVSATAQTDKATLTDLLTRFYSIPEAERSYVYAFSHLSNLAHSAGLSLEKIAAQTKVVESPADETTDSGELVFTASDRAAVDTLPEKLTGEHYILVTTLLEKLQHAADFDGKDAYLQKLLAARETVEAVRAEVDAINTAIRSTLYPADALTLKDKKAVDDIVRRYEMLSPYDQANIREITDVLSAKARLDTELRALVISVVLACAAVLCAVFLVLRIRKYRHKKRAEMEELAALYGDAGEET